jgi:hypothetical protein
MAATDNVFGGHALAQLESADPPAHGRDLSGKFVA